MKHKSLLLLKSLTPPIMQDRGRRLLARLTGQQIRFTGNFTSWADAEARSTGYAAEDILRRTIEAVRKVKRGQAAFERDGVAFDQMEHHFALAWALMRAAARHNRLHVLDFGGALGSTYLQSRALLKSTLDLKWAIVEQPAHVTAGTKEFANHELSFSLTIDEACEHEAYDALLLSSVIQYLPDPLSFVESVIDRKFPSLILDRTPLMDDGVRRLTVQHVPACIYPASYPAWFFSEAELLARFARQYDLIAAWPALDRLHPDGGRAAYKGFLFELKRD